MIMNYRAAFKNSLVDPSDRIFDFQLVEFSKDHILGTHGKLPLLYRYMPANYDNIRSLETNKIFLAPAGSLNDAFEGLPGPVDGVMQNSFEQMYDIAYIKSFTENSSDLLMWGIYADSYKGFCVEYDLNLLPATAPVFYHLFPTVYSNDRILKIDLIQAIDCLNNYKQGLFNADALAGYDALFLQDAIGTYCIKSRDWEHEREWRLIVSYLQMHEKNEPREEDKDLDVLYKINTQSVDFDCVTKVLLGVKMRQDIKEHIRDIGKKINHRRKKGEEIKIYETYRSEEEYQLEEKQVL